MSFKSITICLDSRNDASERLDFALKLARQHEAHLTGMYMTYVPVIYYDPYGQWGPIMNQWETEAKKKYEVTKALALKEAEKEGISFDWVGYRSSEMSSALAHARGYDLTILAQRDTSDYDTDFGHDFYEGFVLKLGRPVLYLPHHRPLPTKIERVMIAWDGSREATRAINDALPILKLAKQIRVVTIAEESKDASHKVDIKTYLSRHGLAIELEHPESSDMSPAKKLLSRSSELKADLLVMGAYGHHRLTELVLGGTTREILKDMTLPVLMSH
jgi:nucleotide-binding universal stress UspA family protein